MTVVLAKKPAAPPPFGPEVKVIGVEGRRLLEIGQKQGRPRGALATGEWPRQGRPRLWRRADPPRDDRAERRGVLVQGQPDLPQIVAALDAPGGLPRRLHGREQEGRQQANDGDHDERLDQRKAPRSPERVGEVIPPSGPPNTAEARAPAIAIREKHRRPPSPEMRAESDAEDLGVRRPRHGRRGCNPIPLRL